VVSHQVIPFTDASGSQVQLEDSPTGQEPWNEWIGVLLSSRPRHQAGAAALDLWKNLEHWSLVNQGALVEVVTMPSIRRTRQFTKSPWHQGNLIMQDYLNPLVPVPAWQGVRLDREGMLARQVAWRVGLVWTLGG
jgi:hypothetical protein